jgi:predicted acetyltransferase
MSLHDLLITKIGPESDHLLRNLFELYIQEMAAWFEIETRADGSYAYDTSVVWEKRYHAYLATVGGSTAGFALAGSAEEWLGDRNAHDVREFFVIREFRRNGVGRKMATLLWNEFPGQWLVRVLESNAPAMRFWRTAISSYTRGSYEEEDRIVNGRPWSFFRFVS